MPETNSPTQRLGYCVAAAHAPHPSARLHRGQLLELRSCVAEILIEIRREDGEIAGVAGIARKAALNAAIVVVANAIELLRISDRQAAQKNSLHQREDRGVGADAKRQRQDRR